MCGWKEIFFFSCKYSAGLEHSRRVQKYHKHIIKVAHIPQAICKSFEIKQYLCVKNKPQFRSLFTKNISIRLKSSLDNF